MAVCSHALCTSYCYFSKTVEMIYYTTTANARGLKAVEDAGTSRPSSALSLENTGEIILVSRQLRHIGVV